MLTVALAAASPASAATVGGAGLGATADGTGALGDNPSAGGATAGLSDATPAPSTGQPLTRIVGRKPAGSTTKKRRVLGDRLPLRKRMTGSDVRSLQGLLRRVGRKARQDGVFGAQTVRMLKSWERSAHRRTDGVLSDDDLKGLQSVVSTVRATPVAGSAGGAPPAPVAPGTPTTPTQVPPATPITSTIPATAFPVSPATATIGPDGLAMAPSGAPAAVVAAIAAGNAIAKTPYRWGGGHASFADTAYDCSGSVSYALHGAGLLKSPLDSTSLESWGVSGPGTWITVYANADHTFMVIAGIRFDTSGRTTAGTRWQPVSTRTNAGFVVRHAIGL